MLAPGDIVSLAVEKPAAGGRMIARHEGQVVLVEGAIPGERVSARIDKADKRLAFASVVRIDEASSDRRVPIGEPRCGGCLYAHVSYPRQVALKAAIIADAFTRIGRIPIEQPAVAASPEHGHRMRARLHVRGGQAGFYLEGTHEICDARATRQLLPESLDAVDAALAVLRAARVNAVSIEIAENVAATERALHVDLAADVESPGDVSALVASAGVTGWTLRAATGKVTSLGTPVVSDPLSALTGRAATAGVLARGPGSFFQANRFLVSALVSAVIEAVPGDGAIVDLYAGVGLFSISLASVGRERITAVEGDPSSGADLRTNAAAWGPAVKTVVGRVEDHLMRERRTYATVLVDPPRTGLSKEAMEAVARHGAERIVYVSCDPPTMARDARRLLDAGYRLGSLQGFDLFPNTPHVEVLGVFDR